MNFNDIEYKRSDYNAYRQELHTLIDKLSKSSDFSEFKEILFEINNRRDHVSTMKTYSEISYSINTEDEFFVEENKYWDEYGPLYESVDIYLYETIIKSNFKGEIIKAFGKQYYNLLECSVKSFSEDIIPLLQEENRLMSEYTALLASAKIMFDNKLCNLSDLSTYMSSNDRNVRISSIKAHTKFFEENEEKFDQIFDSLVKIRDKMAKTMNYKNFIELGYYRMFRTDYTAEMVSKLRSNIIRDFLPELDKVLEKQAKRIGMENITYYDEKLDFLDGNAKLKGDGDYIMEMGKEMYSQMSKESKEFYNYLITNNLFDVKARPSKAMGGYCTLLNTYRMPFIFGNFNGSVDDIDVLTHEAGHALQMYLSRNIQLPELLFPTLDTCEIHSMSMEFFTYPWMNLFFGDDAEKYKTYHYESAIKFLPYGCLVDHFQHEIYQRPNMTAEERKSLWRNLEKKYLPHRDYEDLDLLNRGGYWYRQGHIYKDPFYYIDYVLAQLCALQFLELMKKDYDKAWEIYIEICRVGGKYSFIELVEKSGLKNPFN